MRLGGLIEVYVFNDRAGPARQIANVFFTLDCLFLGTWSVRGVLCTSRSDCCGSNMHV